jgi:hypothetical protein
MSPPLDAFAASLRRKPRLPHRRDQSRANRFGMAHEALSLGKQNRRAAE